jgi:hypothetical protein
MDPERVREVAGEGARGAAQQRIEQQQARPVTPRPGRAAHPPKQGATHGESEGGSGRR